MGGVVAGSFVSVSEAQRASLVTAGIPAGLTVYVTDTDTYMHWTGIQWRSFLKYTDLQQNMDPYAYGSLTTSNATINAMTHTTLAGVALIDAEVQFTNPGSPPASGYRTMAGIIDLYTDGVVTYADYRFHNQGLSNLIICHVVGAVTLTAGSHTFEIRARSDPASDLVFPRTSQINYRLFG
jgi:hypothetical protein